MSGVTRRCTMTPAASLSVPRWQRSIVGADHVDTEHEPGMGSDDFSFMSNRVPGGYVWIGSGPAEAGRFLHNPRYDFNDGILPIGATYWARLVEAELPRAGST